MGVKSAICPGRAGCAVKEAAEKGLIPAEIMASFYKLKKEAEYLASKTDTAAAMKRKQKEKQLGRTLKNYFKLKGGKK